MGHREADAPRQEEEKERLRRRIAELEAEVAQACAREQELAVLTASHQALVADMAKHEAVAHALTERNKELSCLYALSKLVEAADLPLPEILQRVVELLPPAWQFCDVAAARISHRDQNYSTAGFAETPWVQSAVLKVDGQAVGSVAVCYQRECPPADEGPFLAQERHLLDAVAERLGHMIQRLQLRSHSDQLQKRLRALYDESPRPICFFRDGINVACNPACLKLLGYDSEEEFVGRSVLDQIAPSARAFVMRRIEADRRGETIDAHYETRCLRKDGSEFPCDIRVARIHMAEGKLGAAFLDDISQRVQAEIALAQSEARFRALVEGSRDATVVIDPSGQVLYTSPNAARISGYRLGDQPGKSVLDTIHPEDQERVRSAFGRLLAEGSGASTTVAFRGIRQDGSIWWGEANASNLVADASIGGVVVNYRDITERKQAEDALRESETRFRDVAHAHAGIVWEINEHFSITHISGRLREILGYEPDELRGHPVSAFLDPSEADRVFAALASAREGSGSMRDLESWCRSKDGRRVRLSSSGVAFFSPQGKFLGIRGTHLDVTELYWARERRELLLRLHQMSGETDSAISAFLCQACAAQTESPLSFFGMVEPDGSAMVAHVWSPSAHADCQIHDKPLRFPIATAGLWAEPIRQNQAVMVNDFATAPGRRGLPEGHVPITRYLGVPIIKDGKAIAVTGLANKAPPYQDEDVTRVQVLASGISAFLASRSAEQAARRSDARLRTFIDFTADWEYWRRPDGRHEYDSPACERITGHSAQEFLADPQLVETIVHPEDRAAFAAHARQTHSQVPRPGEIEFRIVHTNGETRWIQHDCRPVFENGQFAGTRVSNRDITQQKLADEEKAQLQEQLHHAQKMEAIGTLAGGVAHDFNNILGGVLGGLSLLEMESTNAENQADINDMKELVRRGAELAKQLLGFSRRGKYNVQPLDVSEVAAKTAAIFGSTHRNIIVDRVFAPDLQAALMDHVQLEQVLLNLLLNAAHAMPEGGRVRLQAENTVLGPAEAEVHGVKPGRFVKLVVADTGTGIDPATLPRIFEPFFTTKAPGQGSGLGLASVYGIIKNHGGAVTVESELGRGTNFTLLIPASDKPAAKKSAAPMAIRPGHGTVLVVDDEERLLHLCARLLEVMGYRVLTASGGRVAVELMREHQDEISLVILDLTMPEMSGAKTFEALRRISPKVKVLIASGASEDGQAQELLNRGCNGFLQKPFDAAALSEKILSLR